MAKSERPLFIPLKKEYFEAFERGEKNTEYRLESSIEKPTRWSSRTCWWGREVILSCGYGKARRIRGVITSTLQWRNCRQPDFVKIYGPGKTARVILLTIDRRIDNGKEY